MISKINILISILLIPYFFFTFSNSIYVPGHDEANQIEAALSYYNNGTFSFSNIIPNDFSLRSFKFQNEWPIGFPILLLLFLKLNINQYLALKILKTSIFLITLFIWNRIASINIKGKNEQNIFIIILFLVLLLISQSMTDFIITFLFSIIIYVLQNFHIDYDNFYHHLKIAIVIGMAFIFKFSSIFFLPSTILLILSLKAFCKKLTYIAVYLFIFFFFFFFVYYYNINGGDHKFYNFNFISFSNFRNLFYDYWITDIAIVFTKSLFLDKLYFLLHLYKIKFSYSLYCNLIFLSLSFILVLFKSQDKNVDFFLFFFITNVIFLKIISALFFDIGYQFRPILIERYFWPLTPLMYLIIVKNLFCNQKINKYLFSILFIIVFTIITYDLNIKHKNYVLIEKNYNDILRHINHLKSENNENLVVFADNLQWSIYHQKGIYNVYEINGSDFVNFNNFKNKPLKVIYINDYTNYSIKNQQFPYTNISLSSNLTNLIEVNKSVKIYWKIFY